MIHVLFILQALLGLIVLKVGVHFVPTPWQGFGVLAILAGGWLIACSLHCYRKLTTEQPA